MRPATWSPRWPRPEESSRPGNPGRANHWPADWRSIRFDSYSNDRNVGIVNEFEQVLSSGGDLNGLAAEGSKSWLQLVTNRKEWRRQRAARFRSPRPRNQNKDVDTYSFSAKTGTEIVDISLDRTTMALNSVVELVDANGSVIARSNDSTAESTNIALLVGSAKTLAKGVFDKPDYYTINPHNAGAARGPAWRRERNEHLLRPRTVEQPEPQQPGRRPVERRLPAANVLVNGLDELPGSTVQYADIRFATNGVEILGKPEHSPLVAETVEFGVKTAR